MLCADKFRHFFVDSFSIQFIDIYRFMFSLFFFLSFFLSIQRFSDSFACLYICASIHFIFKLDQRTWSGLDRFSQSVDWRNGQNCQSNIIIQCFRLQLKGVTHILMLFIHNVNRQTIKLCSRISFKAPDDEFHLQQQQQQYLFVNRDRIKWSDISYMWTFTSFCSIFHEMHSMKQKILHDDIVLIFIQWAESAIPSR